MDSTISNFYSKENDNDYFLVYDQQHGSRLDFVVREFELDKIEGEKIADFGCGYGFLFKRMNPINDFYGFDGADIDESKKMANFSYKKVDLNSQFEAVNEQFDYSFCFETLEHLENPYRCLVEIKKITKIGGSIFISIPHEGMTHNTPYPSLIYPVENFEIFLKQLAIYPKKKLLFKDGWPSWILECINLPIEQKTLVFPKNELKFLDKYPVECTNI